MSVHREQLSSVGTPSSLVPEYHPAVSLNQEDLEPEDIEAFRSNWTHEVRRNFETAYPAMMEHGELRPQQKDAIDAFRALLDSHVDDEYPTIRATLAHSMGLGKTVTEAALMVLCGIGKPHNNRRLRGAFIAPEAHMLDNFIGNQDPDKPRGMALVSPETTVSKWTSGNHDTSGDAIAISLQAITKEAKKHMSGEGSDFPFNEIDMFIVDEGDAVLSGEWRSFVEEFQQGRISITGTGTPEQANGASVFELFPESIGEIGFRESIEDYNVTNGRPVHFYTLTPGGSFKVDGLTSTGEIREDDLEHILSHENVRHFAVELATNFAEVGLQVVMYTHAGGQSAAARSLAQKLSTIPIHQGEENERLIIAKTIGSHSGINARTIAEFSKREIDILLSSRMGEAGLDSPHLNVVICLAPTGSKRRALQRAGRLVHNTEGGPLIIVFVAYDVEDWHTQQRPAQLLPHQLFDTGRNHGSIRPKRTTPRSHRQAEANDGTNDIYAVALPAELQQLIRQQRKQYPFTLKSEFTLDGKSAHARPGEYVLDEIAALAGMDSGYLKRILHAEKQYVSTRTINGKEVTFCDESGLLHLDEVIATNGEYSRQVIAAAIGVEVESVRSHMTRMHRNAAYTERYDRILRKTTVRKQRQYGAHILTQVAAHFDGRPLPKQANETAAVEISRTTGRDGETVRAYFEQLGIGRVKRTVAGIPSAIDCYRISEDQYRKALFDLGEKPAVPSDGSFALPHELRDRMRAHTNLSGKELLDQLPPELFDVTEFRTTRGIPREQLSKAVTYLRQQKAEARPHVDVTGLLKTNGHSPDKPVTIAAIAKITDRSIERIRESIISIGLPNTGSGGQTTISYTDAVTWLERQLNSPPLPADQVIFSKSLVQGIAHAEGVTREDLFAIAARASISVTSYHRQGPRRARVDDYIPEEATKDFRKAAQAYLIEKFRSAPPAPDKPEAAAVMTDSTPVKSHSLDALAKRYRLSPELSNAIGAFLLSSPDEVPSDDAVEKLIQKAIRKLKLAIPEKGVLGPRDGRALLGYIVMASEPPIRAAIQQDTAIRKHRLEQHRKIEDENKARKQAGEPLIVSHDAAAAAHVTRNIPVSEWATMSHLAGQHKVSRETMKRVIVECRARSDEVRTLYTMRGREAAFSWTLQLRIRNYIAERRGKGQGV